jgi:hypothetical protein
VRIFLILAALTLSKVGAAQVYFNTQIDWEHGYEYIPGITLINPGGDLFVVGSVENFAATEHFSILASYTNQGAKIWQKKFLPYPNLFGFTYHLAKLPGPYGILLGNYEKPISGGSYDKQIFLTKINLETGDAVWSKEFGFSNYTEQGWTIKPTNDGGVALSGTTFSANSTGPSKMLFLKTDSLGSQIFRKEFTTDPDKYHYAFSFAETDDNGYILIGYRSYNGHCLGCILQEHMNDMVFIKTDSAGNEQWAKVYPSLEWKQILFYSLDLQPLPNGDFLMAGL